MSRPRLLDLFCGAGGAGMGYHRAGFDVVGVDINPQPHYPFEFHQADAMDLVGLSEPWYAWLGDDFDAVHASPPCPRYSAGTPKDYRDGHPDLIGPVRSMLDAIGLPWVIENVEGAPLDVVPSLLSPYAGVTLCGSMFGMEVRRHRRFESNVPMAQPQCRHREQPRVLSVTGSGYGGKHKGHNGTKPDGIEHGRKVMGVDWPMTIAELSNAIPPAYTEWIGTQLLAAIEAAA